VLGGELSP